MTDPEQLREQILELVAEYHDAQFAQADPNTTAEVVESPLDVRPTLELHGRHAEKEPSSMDPRFVVRVVRTRPGIA